MIKTIYCYHDALKITGHQSYVLLCTETNVLQFY